MKFTYEAYARMIESLRKENYSICPYRESYTAEKVCILRHDVDNSLESALEFAQLEKKLGVSSTYFILIRSDFYNPFSKKNSEIIYRISELGHNIGLHFDEKYCGLSENSDIPTVIAEEAESMRRLLGISVNSVSMHRPSKTTLDADYKIPGLVNSYSQRFFRDFKYVSDSRRNWREDVEQIIESGQYPQLHILTHPIWYREQEQSTRQTLLNFICQGNGERYHTLTGEFTKLEEFITEKDIGK